MIGQSMRKASLLPLRELNISEEHPESSLCWMSLCPSIASHLADAVTSVVYAGKVGRAKNQKLYSQSKLCSLMRSRPIRDVGVEAGRPRVAGGEDAPCCVGSVCRGGVGHRFDFPLQFDQPRQDVIQQHSYSPLQISIASHGGSLRSTQRVLVLLRQDPDISPTELQDLLAELGAALVSRLLHGVAQQHETPRQAEKQQQQTQLL